MHEISGISVSIIIEIFENSWINTWNFFFNNPIFLPLLFLAIKILINTLIMTSLNKRFWEVFSPMLQSFGADISFICVSLMGGFLIEFKNFSKKLIINKEELFVLFFILIFVYIVQYFIFRLQERMGKRRDSVVYIFRTEIRGIKWKTLIRLFYIFSTYIIGYYCYISVLCLYN